VIATAFVVVAAMGVVDSVVGRSTPSGLLSAPLVSATSVIPAGRGTSSWFCTGGSGAAGGTAATVVMANPTDQVVHGTFTAVATNGRSRSVPVVLAAGGMSTQAPAQLVQGAWLAASIELDRSGVGVDETVSSALGWSEAPCSSSTASRWYFPDGSTSGSDSAVLSIFNPGVTQAVVDTELVTSSQQALQPAAYQGVTVGPGSLVTENVGDHYVNGGGFAAVVTAVSGSVVATELQSVGAAGNQGLALVPGAPSTSTSWAFPVTEEVGLGQVYFHLFDPSSRAARISMESGFSSGSSSPVVLTVPAHGTTTVDAGKEPRLPVDTPFQVRFVSTDGVGVVASRSVAAAVGGGAPQVGMTLGVAAGSKQWLVPAVTAPGTTAWSFTVEDLSSAPVSVTIEGGSGASTVQSSSIGPFTVSPTAPRVFPEIPPAPIGTVPIIVTATGPVAVELDPEPVGTPGVVVLPALPVG